MVEVQYYLQPLSISYQIDMAPAGTASRRWCGTIHFPTDHTQWVRAAHCINTFNLCGTHAYWCSTSGGKSVPPLVWYYPLPDGSYAVGRLRALHQH